MERAEERRTIDLDEVRRLMARATGDEKHDESSTSTLDALAVLYERVLRVDPADPAGPSATGSSSARGTGRWRTTRSSRTSASSPKRGSTTSWTGAASSGAIPTGCSCPGVEASTGSLGHGLPMSIGVALALRAKPAAPSRAWWSSPATPS